MADVSATGRFGRRKCAAVLLVTVGMTQLLGCAPEPEPTPTPTAAFASEEEAFAAAEEVYRAYNDALNQIDPSDPETFEPIFSLTSGEFEESDRKNFSIMQAEKHEITGDAVVLSFRGQSASPLLDEVVASVCLDVTAVEIVSAEGASLVAPDRPDVYALKVIFRTGDEAPITISSAERQENATCGG